MECGSWKALISSNKLENTPIVMAKTRTVFKKDKATLHVIFQKDVKAQNISNDIFCLKIVQ